MKQSKLELYREYLLANSTSMLVIRFDGDESIIIPELRRIKSDIAKNVTGLERNCPNMAIMRRVVDENRYLKLL